MKSAAIKRLQDRKAQLLASMRTLNSKAQDENRDLAEDETKQYTAWESELDRTNASLKREQRLADEERSMGGTGVTRSARGPEEKEEEEEKETPDGEAPKFKPVFRSFGEQLQSVIGAGRHPSATDQRLNIVQEQVTEMAAAAGMSEGVPSDGGFLVQPDFSSTLLRRTYDIGAILSRVSSIPVTGNGLKINGIDETSRVNGSRYGGVQAYWVDEAGTVAAKKPKFRQLELDLKKLMGIAYLTDELIADAAALEAFVGEAFAEEFSFKLEDGIVWGTGAGQLLGFMNSPALVTVSKESGPQAADTVVKENIFKMWSRMWARSRPNAIWLINQDIEPQLYGLVLGQSGIYFPAGTFANNSGYGMLMGRPVIPVEYASTLGDLGDIMLVDPSQYLMINKGGLQAATSIHVRFLTDEMTLRFTLRTDGEPTWHSALTPYKGTNTLSPFVTLEAR